MATHRRCSACGENLPIGRYGTYRKNGRTWTRGRCVACHNMMTRYGINVADFNRILAAQGGACAICRSPVNGTTKRAMSVDHCHTSRAIRGILCLRCNCAIGLFDDSTEKMLSAVAYITKGNQW